MDSLGNTCPYKEKEFLGSAFYALGLSGFYNSNNLYYACCAYDDNFLAAAIKQHGVDQILFGTESPGSGGVLRPDTGKQSDVLIPVVDSLEFLSKEDKMKIFQKNPLKVFTKMTV